MISLYIFKKIAKRPHWMAMFIIYANDFIFNSKYHCPAAFFMMCGAIPTSLDSSDAMPGESVPSKY